MRLKRTEKLYILYKMGRRFNIDNPQDVNDLIRELDNTMTDSCVTIDCTPHMPGNVTVEKDMRPFDSPSEAVAFLRERRASEIPSADYCLDMSAPETVMKLIRQLEKVLTTNRVTIDCTPHVPNGVTVKEDKRQFDSPSEAVVFLREYLTGSETQ